jgi:hypothetical protein
LGGSIKYGLADLISAQKNLKYLYLIIYINCKHFAELIPSLTKISSTLVKFDLYARTYYISFSFSFIAKFINLQELKITFNNYNTMENFKPLQYIIYSQLQILEFKSARPRCELLINFLENNGNTLKVLDVGEGKDDDSSLNSAIVKFCPNLRKLSIRVKNDELETLKIVFNTCQYLESIKIWCGGKFLSEKAALEMVVKYSPKNYHELNLHDIFGGVRSELLLPEELEFFFVSWTNRISQRSISLDIFSREKYTLGEKNEENKKILEKYINLGVINKFKIK